MIERRELLRVTNLVAERIHKELFDMPLKTPKHVKFNRRKYNRRKSKFTDYSNDRRFRGVITGTYIDRRDDDE